MSFFFFIFQKKSHEKSFFYLTWCTKFYENRPETVKIYKIKYHKEPDTTDFSNLKIFKKFGWGRDGIFTIIPMANRVNIIIF